jgi:hypothetical protein
MRKNVKERLVNYAELTKLIHHPEVHHTQVVYARTRAKRTPSDRLA